MEQCLDVSFLGNIPMIDEEGFRLNVGIILSNAEGKLFWGKRSAKSNGWQFPQGGIKEMESSEEAMFRELEEELGLIDKDVKIIGKSQKWLKYHLPNKFRRHYSKPLCIGQKQKWYLLRLMSGDESIRLDATDSPEFNDWLWVDYWYPLEQVIDFKRDVYETVLTEFEPLVKGG